MGVGTDRIYGLRAISLAAAAAAAAALGHAELDCEIERGLAGIAAGGCVERQARHRPLRLVERVEEAPDLDPAAGLPRLDRAEEDVGAALSGTILAERLARVFESPVDLRARSSRR